MKTLRRETAIAALLIGSVAGTVACSSSPSARADDHAKSAAKGFTVTKEQGARIHVQTLAVTTFTPAVQTTGTVQFNGDHSTQVLAPIGGPATRIFVEPGAVVRAGTPLAAVSSPDFAAAVAGLRKAQATAVNARRIADQDQQLFNNDALARRDLEQAQTDAASADADRESAEQQVRALGVDERVITAIRDNHSTGPLESVIRAPIAGTVVERLITPGELLAAGTTPCFTIADLSTMWVSANVFEADLASVARGDKVVISADAAPHPLVGTVDYVAALVDTASKATGVRVVVPNPGAVLKRDMYVRVAIQSRRPKQGILVPTSAVLRDDDNLPFVFLALSDGSFGRRRVALGTQVGDAYEVTSGVAAGDRVVTDGALFLQFAESQ